MCDNIREKKTMIYVYAIMYRESSRYLMAYTYIHVRIYCQTVADVISQNYGHLRTVVISEPWSSQKRGHLKTAVISVRTNIYRNI